MEFPIRITFITSKDYQTRQLNTKEGNLTAPICTCHNTHTHTDNTRQPEPQRKSSSCSSAIPIHNSKDVISSHNSRNATCLTPTPSHNSRITSKSTFEISPKFCRSRISKASKNIPSASAISPGAALNPPGETRFQTAWRGTRTARHQAPLLPLFCRYHLARRPSPPGATRPCDLLEMLLSPSGSNTTTKCHTSTRADQF